jgi:hypothetical protein
MAKRPSKHLRAPRPLLSHFARTDSKADGDWLVGNVAAGQSAKTYLCPGCGRAIAPQAAHLVAWPSMPSIGSPSAVGERRHWHTPCWERRR